MKRVLLKPKGITILDTIEDPQLFARWFRDRQTWTAWFAFLAALFALGMSNDQRLIYRRCTGRDHIPHEQAQEAWLVIGRRGGKSFIMALVAVFLGCFRDYRPFLTPGERATIMIVAADRKQSRIVLRYIRALLTDVPMLARLICNVNAISPVTLTIVGYFEPADPDPYWGPRRVPLHNQADLRL